MYMHRFGGVYADLDLVTLSSLPEHLPILNRVTPPPIPIVYLGLMGDENYEHSIPNAFMVSTTPRHPFWLKPLEFVKEHQFDQAHNYQPESITGPVALRTCVHQWEKDREEREGSGTFAEVRVLPRDKVLFLSFFLFSDRHLTSGLDLSIQLA
jgi:mannosyltransferase OCH1-like enzyme